MRDEYTQADREAAQRWFEKIKKTFEEPGPIIRHEVKPPKPRRLK